MTDRIDKDYVENLYKGMKKNWQTWKEKDPGMLLGCLNYNHLEIYAEQRRKENSTKKGFCYDENRRLCLKKYR